MVTVYFFTFIYMHGMLIKDKYVYNFTIIIDSLSGTGTGNWYPLRTGALYEKCVELIRLLARGVQRLCHGFMP